MTASTVPAGAGPSRRLTRTGSLGAAPHVPGHVGYGRRVHDLREAPTAAHPEPGRLPGERLPTIGLRRSIWLDEREPPLPRGFTPIDLDGDDRARADPRP